MQLPCDQQEPHFHVFYFVYQKFNPIALLSWVTFSSLHSEKYLGFSFCYQGEKSQKASFSLRFGENSPRLCWYYEKGRKCICIAAVLAQFGCCLTFCLSPPGSHITHSHSILRFVYLLFELFLHFVYLTEESLGSEHESCENLYKFVKGAVTKQHTLGGLNNRNLFSHSSGSWQSVIKVSAGLVSSETSLLGLQMAAFSLCSQPWSLSLYVLISSFHKDMRQIVLGPILSASF